MANPRGYLSRSVEIGNWALKLCPLGRRAEDFFLRSCVEHISRLACTTGPIGPDLPYTALFDPRTGGLGIKRSAQLAQGAYH